MIKAYQKGVPGNGKPFPDGSKIVKLEWRPKKITAPPFSASAPDTVPGDLTQVEFIVKDSKRFSDTHGWGYAMFDYDAKSGTFAPATSASKPPVGHDAKCGAACHTLAASKDYIFTAYPKRRASIMCSPSLDSSAIRKPVSAIRCRQSARNVILRGGTI